MAYKYYDIEAEIFLLCLNNLADDSLHKNRSTNDHLYVFISVRLPVCVFTIFWEIHKKTIWQIVYKCTNISKLKDGLGYGSPQQG